MQPAKHSFFEACFSTACGFLISLLVTWVYYWALGIQATLLEGTGLVVILTVVSVLRSYWVRRLFNHKLKRLDVRRLLELEAEYREYEKEVSDEIIPSMARQIGKETERAEKAEAERDTLRARVERLEAALETARGYVVDSRDGIFVLKNNARINVGMCERDLAALDAALASIGLEVE
jgi:hypothetical protein